MRLRVDFSAVTREGAISLIKRWGFVALWIFGGGALVGLVFVLSFILAMRVEMRSTEVSVPDLGGLTFESASGQVEELELVLQVVDQRNDPTVASGRVLQQEPPAGASVRRGRKIKLVMSLGGKVLEVPDLTRQPTRTAAMELRQIGLMPGDESWVHSTSASEGVVIAQVPPARTPAVPNTRVHRLVSSGPPGRVWVMPDLDGVPRSRAERWISESGFRKGAVRRVRVAGRSSGTVIGQLPLAGYPIKDKDVVELTVAE